jgi:hypothetical protein
MTLECWLRNVFRVRAGDADRCKNERPRFSA